MLLDQQYGPRREVVGRISVPLPREFPRDEERELFHLGTGHLSIEGLGKQNGRALDPGGERNDLLSHEHIFKERKTQKTTVYV